MAMVATGQEPAIVVAALAPTAAVREGELEDITMPTHVDVKACEGDADAVATAADEEEVPDPREQTYVRSLVWCCVLMALLFGGQLIVQLSVLPDRLIKYYNGGVSCEGTVASHDADCKHATAHETLVMAIVTSVGCFLTFLGSPMLGMASDAYGRRPALIFCSVLNLLQSVVLLLWAYDLVPLELFFVSNILAAFDSTSVILAYLSDTVPPAKRAYCFGLTFATLSAMMVVAPFIGEAVSSDTCIIISAAVALVYFLATCVLPESLEVSMRVPFRSRHLNPCAVMSVLGRYTMFRRLALVVLVSEVLVRGRFAVIFPFLKTQFGVTEQQFAFVALTFGLLGVVAQSVILKLMVARMTNVQIMNSALVAVILAQVGYGLANRVWMIYVIEGAACLGFLSFPAISAMKSNNVDAREQGKIQGALYGVKQLGGGIGPAMFGAVFNAVSSDDSRLYYPQLIWWVAAGLSVAGLLIGLTVPNLISSEESTAYEQAKHEIEEEQAQEAAARKAEHMGLGLSASFKSSGGVAVNHADTLRVPLIVEQQDSQVW